MGREALWAKDSSLALVCFSMSGVLYVQMGRNVTIQGFSTLFYYKDRLFQESATSTTQQVRALHPQHMPKFKNMLQRARVQGNTTNPQASALLKLFL